MLEGLEISEVRLSYVLSSNDTFRIDSNFFQKEFIRSELVIRGKKSLTLAARGAVLQSFGAYSLNNQVEYLDEGVPFIRGVNMKKGRVSFSNLICISEEANSLLWKSEVKPGMVLLSMSGTIGDVALASKNWTYPINSNQDIAKIDTAGKVNPYFLYSFLLSKFGQNYLLREARGSVQQHVFLSQIEKFEIPTFSSFFDFEIQKTIEKSDVFLSNAEAQYIQAEKLLLSTLDMASFSPILESLNIKSFKESFLVTGRLDAEYYQPKFENLLTLLRKDGLTIGDVAPAKHKRFESAKTGDFDYIEIGGMRGDGTVASERLPCAEAPSRATQRVHQGDIVTSTVRPIRRLSALITPTQNDYVCSSGFVVLQPAQITAETLLVYLRLPIICELMDLHTSASLYPAISEKDLLGLPIPKMPVAVQNEIASLVQQSFILKAKSEHLLEAAKRAVEIAIEQDEAAGMAYLAIEGALA